MSLYTMSRPARRQAKPRQQMVAGPVVGMRDSLDPQSSNDPSRAFLIQNMRPSELDKPTTFVGIPGFDQAGAQLGASGKRTVQLITQFTTLAGTEYTVAIVGGQGLYTYNWTTEAWTQVVTVANLTTASVTLSETARCYAEIFTNKLLVSDGTNDPFLWDGTSGAGGLTSLTAADVFYGQPRIHFAKAFGIKNTERSVFEWSEENDATIGYETAPYSNSWQLGQTDQEGLYAIVPTNNALYYLRARSTGKVLGAVTPEFTSDGTHEGVSQNVGTISPDGACVVGERVFFIDADARPHVIQGEQAVPLFDDLRETIRGLDVTKLSSAITRYDPGTGLVLFGVVELGQTHCSAILAYNPVLNVPAAVWRGYTFTALGVVKNASGVPVLMHGAADGYVYDHGTPTGALLDYELNAGTQAIQHVFEGCHLGANESHERLYSRADVILRAESESSAVSFKYTTPYGTGSSGTDSVTGAGSRYDEATTLYDGATIVYGYDTVERHVAFGIRGRGRWIRPRVAHEVAGERFGVSGVAVQWAPAGDSAGAA